MTNIDDLLPSAQDCMKTIALAEAEKASASLRRMASAEAEKQALMEKFAKPSGVSDEERMKRAAAIIQRAVSNGMTEVFLGRVPNLVFTDHGRAINNAESGWPETLVGRPRQFYEIWKERLEPAGYRLKAMIVEWPNGFPGDVGMYVAWN